MATVLDMGAELLLKLSLPMDTLGLCCPLILNGPHVVEVTSKAKRWLDFIGRTDLTWEENNKGNRNDSFTPVQNEWTIVASSRLDLAKH